MEVQVAQLTDNSSRSRIKIGTFQEIHELRQAIINGGRRISRDADDLLNRIVLARKFSNPNFLTVTNANLGYPHGCTMRKSFAALDEVYGAKKLPQETGPQYCHQCFDQDQDKWRLKLVYSDPVIDRNGRQCIFGVGDDRDGLNLFSFPVNLDAFYPCSQIWIYGHS